MEIQAPDNTRQVKDYEFVMVSGVSLPVNIDPKAGDEIIFNTEEIRITLSAKPGIVDTAAIMPPEYITLYRKHIAVIHERERTIRDVTPEEKADLKKTLDTLLKSDPAMSASETN